MPARTVPISHYVMTHYNALMAVKGGLEAQDAVDREALVDGMEGLTIEAPTGPVSIGAADHHVTMNMFLAKTEGAALTTVEALGALAPEAGCSRVGPPMAVFGARPLRSGPRDRNGDLAEMV